MAIEDYIDFYMFENDKHMWSGRSGKQRSKLETQLHSNRFDPSGNCRKIVHKIRNTEKNRYRNYLNDNNHNNKRSSIITGRNVKKTMPPKSSIENRPLATVKSLKNVHYDHQLDELIRSI